MSTPAMPYEHLGEALATDYFMVREQFTDEQWDMFIRTRRFVDREVLPVINDYWERADFPWPLARRLADLGIVGDDIQGYGCPGMSPLAVGLVHRSEEHTSELQSRSDLVCRLLLEKKKK